MQMKKETTVIHYVMFHIGQTQSSFITDGDSTFNYWTPSMP